MNGFGDYIQYFGLREAPFRLSPDPEFFFPARPHVAAKEVLKYGIGRGEGFLVLIGTAGTGKTLLLRMLLQELDPKKQPAVLLSPAVGPEGLLHLLLEELDADDPGVQDRGILLKRFQDAMLDLAEQGRELLVVVDEAQNVPRETLEQLRLLSNLETRREKLLQIVLVGQPELEDVLADPALGQLTQRVAVKEVLRPLSREETAEYVAFRLAKAGRGDMRLDRRTLDRVYERTKGIPRLVNRLMDRALLMACAAGKGRVGTREVQESGETVPMPAGVVAEASRWRRAAALAVLSMTLLAGGFVAGRMLQADTGEQAARPAVAREAKAPGGDVLRVVAHRAYVRSGPGKAFDPVALAAAGQVLRAEGRQADWWRVAVHGSDGAEIPGWIHDSVVSAREDAGSGAKKMDR
ncbi:AAA family ATPase [Dissulfurirhabdus thermomarina]|uniref:AAA family ATPase n=1 Tax=Dissulfurirhabdus thermomarina TaxID=1765737 RepID=A0A6N9TS91_DISTH|nr:AAA family ATPase [Dissulfurirhabdus thermomarina]NDY42317.1 AAA family ATPase [Dissulfurirhabdus thermomarina]NMX22424.1 AAA family ATPase [Dissulfurirhabdus thermomarina]